MYKTELVRKVAKETRLSQRVVSDVLNETIEQVTSTLRRKGEVTLPGFGTFYTRSRRAVKIRSIRTGKSVEIPAHRVAAFRVGELVRRAVWKVK